jgi:hypothetical protein
MLLRGATFKAPASASNDRRIAMNSVLVERPSVAVEADIEFLLPGEGRPFSYGGERPIGAEPETTEFERHRVIIEDVRPHPHLSMAANGATLGHWPTAVRSFYDDQELRRRYYPEAAEIIKGALRADRVVVFDHNVRRGKTGDPSPGGYPVGRPVHHAHTDYTPLSASKRLERELGTDADALAGARFMQVNLWRPIRGPLRDAPLAICDGATVSRHSLRPADLRYADRTGEIYYLAHEPAQRWYFASDMSIEEAWLFKNFDSATTRGTVTAAPHSAFEDRRYLKMVPRESIEVRAFALFLEHA